MQEAIERSTTPRRRDILGAAGFSGLAAVALAGFARPDGKAVVAPSTNLDSELLAACVLFSAVHEVQERDNARSGGTEAETARIGQDWYSALDAVITAPRPQTVAGRMALARAAHVALVDQISGCGSDIISEVASPEEALAIMALDALRSAAA